MPPATLPITPSINADPGVASGSTEQGMDTLQMWLDALLSLRAANPLLSLPDAETVPVGVPHAFSEIFKLLVHRAKPVTLWDSRNLAFEKSVLMQPGNYPARPAAFEKVRRLNAQADALLQSQDVNVLFVGFGTLTWQDEAAQTFCSPLLLIPVTLLPAPNGAGFIIERMEQEIELNPLLRHRLELDNAAAPHVLPPLPEETYLVASSYLAEVAARIEKRDGWSVEETCFLCRLPLLKMRLYEDIAQQKTHALGHPLVRALADQNAHGDVIYGEPALQQNEGGEADFSAAEFQLLDADPAQERALQAAARGESFVLHGPPGTGKTQTITNIVGQCIALGKSVLLVSGRVASLDAVQQRLRRRGLGSLCLSAHSMTTSKRDVLQQLGQSLKPDGSAPAPPLVKMPDSERKALEQLRLELDAVAAALHQARAPLGISLYAAHARIADSEARVGRQEPLRFGAGHKPIALSSPANYQAQEEAAVRLAGSPLRDRLHENSLWDGAFGPAQTVLPDLPGTVRHQLAQALTVFGELRAATETLSEKALLPLPLLQTTSQVEGILRALQTVADALPTSVSLVRQHGDAPDFSAAIAALRAQAQPLALRAAQLHETQKHLADTFETEALDSLTVSEIAALAHRLHDEGEAVLKLLCGDDWREMSEKHDSSLREALLALQKACQELHHEGTLLAETCGVAATKLPDVLKMGGILPIVVQTAQQAAQLSVPRADWFSQDTLAHRKKLLNEAESRASLRRLQREKLLNVYEPSVLLLDHAALRESLGTHSAQTHWMLSTPAQLRSRRILQAALKPGVLLKERDLSEDLEMAVRIRAGDRWFDENAPALREAFNTRYQEDQTNWDTLRQQLNAAEAFCARVFRSGLMHQTPENSLPLRLVSQMTDATGERQAALRRRSETVLGLLAAASEAWKQLGLLVAQSAGGMLPSATLAFAELAQWCAERDQAMAARSEIRKQVLRLRKPGADRMAAEMRADLAAVCAFTHSQTAFASDTAEFARQSGLASCETPATWTALCEGIEQALVLHHQIAFLDPRLAASLLDIFGGEDAARRNAVEAAHASLHAAAVKANLVFAALSDTFAPAYLRVHTLPLREADFPAVREWLQARLDAVPLMEGARELLVLRRDCDTFGLTDFFARHTAPLSPDDTARAFRAAFFRGWTEAIESDVSVLQNFNTSAHEKKTERFCQMDRKLHEAASGKIRQAIKGSINKQTLRDEIAVLTGQLARRRTGEVRGLLAQMPHLLLALKPCVMMNPLSVRKYLDPDAISFDVVLFDDASQIATEEAIGAILRGKQVIIAGDQQQLPPLPLMEDTPENKESVLDAACRLAARGLPSFARYNLNWHYRSMNESLIAYSRRYFYPDLISFPSAAARAALETAILPVTDDAETARLVVDRVFAYAAREPAHSIGIITLDEAQQQAVLSEIARRTPEARTEEADADSDAQDDDEPSNTPETLFVKTIENVQGDERDMVVLCVPTEPERWNVLYQAGGNRLLNVAATRARRHMIVATTLSASDTWASELESDLPAAAATPAALVRAFLESVEQSQQAFGDNAAAGLASGVEAEIARALSGRGYLVRRQVGLSDYTVDVAVVDARKPDHYLLGITCDGASYASAHTARQRDRQRPQMLQERGWHLLRVWSAEWNRNPQKQLERIEAAIAAALKA